MQRPISIVNFERCYLGAWLLGLISTVLNWNTMEQMTATRQAEAQFGTWYMPAVTAIGLIISLILWYFIARRGSAIAKWILVVLFAFGVIGFVMGLAMHTMPAGLLGIVSVVSFVLQAIAVWLLFRPDTKPWFGEKGGDAA